MRRLVTSLSVVAMVAMAPLAYGQPDCLFDWTGYLQLNGPDNTVGTMGTCLAVFNVVQNDPCFPVDTATNEYTVVIDNLFISSAVSLGGGNYQTTWSGGDIRVYEDPAKNADFALPATFTDGTLILSGGPYASFARLVFSNGTGSGGGDFDWTGGSRLEELTPCLQQNAWHTFIGIDRNDPVPPGYIEIWDGQFYPNCAVPVQPETWGSIKAMYE
jgi:hypothetical protein